MECPASAGFFMESREKKIPPMGGTLSGFDPFSSLRPDECCSSNATFGCSKPCCRLKGCSQSRWKVRSGLRCQRQKALSSCRSPFALSPLNLQV